MLQAHLPRVCRLVTANNRNILQYCHLSPRTSVVAAQYSADQGNRWWGGWCNSVLFWHQKYSSTIIIQLKWEAANELTVPSQQVKIREASPRKAVTLVNMSCHVSRMAPFNLYWQAIVYTTARPADFLGLRAAVSFVNHLCR